jgi:hypothetical protein
VEVTKHRSDVGKVKLRHSPSGDHKYGGVVGGWSDGGQPPVSAMVAGVAECCRPVLTLAVAALVIDVAAQVWPASPRSRICGIHMCVALARANGHRANP